MKEKEGESGMKVLWGSGKVLGDGGYMKGGGSKGEFDVVGGGGVEIKNGMDGSMEVGGRK